MNLMRLKKGKDKKLGEKGVTTFILTVVTGSLVNEAGSNVFPGPATGSAAPHRLNPLGSRPPSLLAPCPPSSLLPH